MLVRSLASTELNPIDRSGAYRSPACRSRQRVRHHYHHDKEPTTSSIKHQSMFTCSCSRCVCSTNSLVFLGTLSGISCSGGGNGAINVAKSANAFRWRICRYIVSYMMKAKAKEYIACYLFCSRDVSLRGSVLTLIEREPLRCKITNVLSSRPYLPKRTKAAWESNCRVSSKADSL